MRAPRVMAGVLLLALLAACASETRVRVGGGAAGIPPPGTSTSGASVAIDTRSGSALGAVAAAVVIGVLINRDASRESASGGMPDRAAPPMAEGRDINEQDCTRPILRPGANLRCR